MPGDPNLVIGAFDSLANGIKPYADDQIAEERANKPLSKFERAMGLVLAGKLSPRDAAIHVHHDAPMSHLDGQPDPAPPTMPNGPPPPGGPPAGAAPAQQSPFASAPPPMLAASPAPAQGPSYGYAPPTPGATQSAPGVQFSPAQSPPPPAPTPAAPPPMPMPSAVRPGIDPRLAAFIPQQDQNPTYPQGPQLPAPETRGDMGSLMQAAPFIKAANDSADEKMMRALLTQQTRLNLGDQRDASYRRGQDFRGSAKAAELNMKSQQFDQIMQYRYDALQSMMERTEKMIRGARDRQGYGHQMNLELESLKLKSRELLTMQNNVGRLESSIGEIIQDPGVQQTIVDLKQQIVEQGDKLKKDLEDLQQKGTTRGMSIPSETGGVAPIGEDPNTPAIPPSDAPQKDTSKPFMEPSKETLAALGPPSKAMKAVGPNYTPKVGSSQSSSTTVSTKAKGPAGVPFPTGKTKVDPDGVVWEQMSDGSARKKKGS